MSTTIPDLPASALANDTDQMLLRQPAGAAGTDKRVTVSQIRNINIGNLPTLSNPPNPQAGDNMIIARGGVNHRVQFQHVGFEKGVRMWFFENSDINISGWTQVAVGDTLLGVKGGSEYTQGGTTGGTWQQVGHSLTQEEMPRHSHTVRGAGANLGSGNQVKGFKAPAGFEPVTQFWETLLHGGVATNPDGPADGQPHNHGDTWRPLASVGIICVKD